MHTFSIPALFAFLIFLNTSCTDKPDKKDKAITTTTDTTAIGKAAPQATDTATAAEMLAKKQVPVLCYHNIRSLRAGESQRLIEYYVPIENFKAQIKMLADSGYHTITPDQYHDYLLFNKPLPSKPVMITFDDTDEEQFSIGATELNKYGFKGVYFIMTISIGRPRYMSKAQIKELADSGHIIAAHTWDHHNVKGYGEGDWDVQFLKPREKLEELTGKPVAHFAYPFGVWKPEAIPELKKRGYKTAFQLSANKRDSLNPQFTIRRMIIPGNWDIKRVYRWIRATFPDAD